MAKKRSKDNTAPSIAELEQQKRRLCHENDPEKLEKVKKQLDYLLWGIK